MYRMEDRHWWFVARRNLVLMALRRLRDSLPKSGFSGAAAALRILDVGCGTGGTLERLRPFGQVVGLDLETLALEFCRRRDPTLRLVRGSATALPFASGAFDVVVAMDVLEHIPDHAAAAREIARVLAPGGALIATVPAYRALWSRHDVALRHQRRYVAKEVRLLLQGAGLRVERLTYTVSAILPIVWAVRMGQKLRAASADAAAAPRSDVVPTPALTNQVLRGLLDLENRVALRAHVPFGVTVFAIARKDADR